MSKREKLLAKEAMKKLREELERLDKLSIELASKAPLILSVEDFEKIIRKLSKEDKNVEF